MDSSKIKNYLITLLLFVNFFMLIIVVIDKGREFTTKYEMSKNLQEFYSAKNVSLSGVAGYKEKSLPNYKSSRDLSKEKAIVLSFLGDDIEVSKDRGNIVKYMSKSGIGSALFRGTGNFEISFVKPRGPKLTGDPVEMVKELYKKLDPASKNDRYELLKESDDYTLVRVTGDINGIPLYNYSTNFMFQNGYLVYISGLRIFDIITEAPAVESLGMHTILIRLLEQTGPAYPFKEVISVEQGYIMYSQVSDSSEFLPVWRITTDQGEYFLNSIYGTLEPAPR